MTRRSFFAAILASFIAASARAFPPPVPQVRISALTLDEFANLYIEPAIKCLGEQFDRDCLVGYSGWAEEFCLEDGDTVSFSAELREQIPSLPESFRVQVAHA